MSLPLLLASACGSSDDGVTSADFEGKWQLTADTGSYDCGQGKAPTTLGSDPYFVRLEANGSAAVNFLELDPKDLEQVTCTYRYQVSGSRAVLDGDQSCEVSLGAAPQTTTWTEDTITLTGDTFHERGSWHSDVGCSGDTDATYERR